MAALDCILSGTNISRFEEKYEPIPWSGCWIWTACMVGEYGRFYVSPPENRLNLAHRASWRMYKGIIPSEMDVLHRCDVPACVNPDHLFLGTALDNIHDRMSKGRPHNVPSGERNSQSKLTAIDVVEIRRLHDNKIESDEKIAERFSVSSATVYYIAKRITWK